MMIALSILLSTPKGGASDYFPTQPGLKLTYQESGSDGSSNVTVDEIGHPTTILSQSVIPITTKTGDSKRDSTAYYLVEATGIYLMANELSQPLSEPIPLIKCENDRGTWDFDTKLGKGDSIDFLRLHGETKPIGQREVFGKKVDAIEVKLVATKGAGKSAMVDTQTSIYGKGIGLIEMTSVTRFLKEKGQRKLKLIKIEVPKGS